MRTKMQKLLTKLKNTPRNTSLVSSSVSSGLNKEETLSVQNKSLVNDNLEENQLSGKREQDLRVPVLNMRGEPLMPTIPAKARHLLEDGKAKVVKRKPFIIQLTIATGETKQEVTLGIDSGYNYIGYSVITEKEELISGEVELRKDVSKKITERRMYRKTRRSKLWYRKPRFDNRKRREGWLPPSLQHKFDSHKRIIKKLKEWFPVTETIIEVATFDQQKMENPEISGVEYQQGELQGYHVKQYLLEKFDYKCVYCGKEDIPLEVEHIIPKSRGGSNRVSNLTISCRDCNLKKDNQTAEEFGFSEVQKQAKESLKSTAFMNVIRKRLVKEVGAKETFGYITKKGRIDNDLEKSHVNDAFIIAGGTDQKRCKSYKVTQTRRNNRSIQTNRKGFSPSIRKKRYKFQPNDLVRCEGKVVRVKGSHCYGKRVILEDLGSKNVKKVELITYGKGFVFN